MKNAMNIIQQQAGDALHRLGIDTGITVEHVAQSTLHQNAYWEQSLLDGDKLLFVRFFSPITQREEVFLGNILFNAFLCKSFSCAVKESRLGSAELVANDLENFYFLIRTDSDIKELVDVFVNEVIHNLPDLFFGELDEERGVYGDLERMFAFRKSDFEPFPVYAMPQFLAPHLEKAVRRELRKLLKDAVFHNRLRTVFATLAFFYGRTSGSRGDTQSFSNFIDHLVNDADYDGLLIADDVKKAFNISAVNKTNIKESIDKETYNTEGLRMLLSNLSEAFQSSIDSGSAKWLMGFLHKNGKFLNISPTEYISSLLMNAQLGYQLFPKSVAGKNFLCRICNTIQAEVEDRYVTIGLNAFRFNNQSVRQQSEKICVRCALYAYLAQKLLGTEMISAGGKLPQVPKTYNLIFHYGKHDSNEIEQLVQRIDLIWDLVQIHEEAEQIRREVSKQVKSLQDKLKQIKGEGTRQKREQELTQRQAELQQAQEKVSALEDQILQVYPWIKDLGGSSVPSENPSLDTLASIQLSESRIERHILGLGMGGYRMILFVLPQIRPPYGAKEHDFAQRRFSNSRVTVSAMLAFLRQLCGCDGPFYYQSLPTLTPSAFQPDTFYIRDEPIHVERAQKEYEAVTQLAWRLIWQSGSDGFVRKVILAEKLLEDPLGTFSAIMRDSPILGQREGNYKRLKAEYRQEWETYDLIEYAKFVQKLSILQEVSLMAIKVDREKLDEFCPNLFGTLDNLGLLPLSLSKKPNEFEKYPRLLFGSIQRYNDVEAGFREWESRVLRDSPHHKEKYYPSLENLRQWMVQHREIFMEKVNMQHLRTSLYARLFNYLYPRRVLANAYCVKERGNSDALSEEALTLRFPQAIEAEIQKVKETYKNEWETIITDTRFSLMAKSTYYEKIIRGEKPANTLEETGGSNFEFEREEL